MSGATSTTLTYLHGVDKGKDSNAPLLPYTNISNLLSKYVHYILLAV